MNGKTKYFFIILGVLILGYSVWYFSALIAYILISVVLSFIGRPLVDYLNKLKLGKFRLPKALNATITLFLLWFMISLFFRIFVPLVAGQADQLSQIDGTTVAQNLQEPLNWIKDFAEKYHLTPEGQTLEEYVTAKIVSVLNFGFVSNIFGSVTNTLGNIFIAVFAISFMTFFFLKDERLFYEAVLALIPEKYEERVRNVMSSIKKLLMRYFIGIIVEVCSIIVLVTTGLTIVGTGFDHALVIGLTVGLMNVVPYIGPIVGAVVGLLIGLTTHLEMPFYSELLPLLGYMSIVFAVVQLIDNIVFQPLIYSNSVNAHPLEIFVVIMMAGSVAGVTGMILAIPTYTVLRVIAKEFFNKFKLVKKLTEKI